MNKLKWAHSSKHDRHESYAKAVNWISERLGKRTHIDDHWRFRTYSSMHPNDERHIEWIVTEPEIRHDCDIPMIKAVDAVVKLMGPGWKIWVCEEEFVNPANIEANIEYMVYLLIEDEHVALEAKLALS